MVDGVDVVLVVTFVVVLRMYRGDNGRDVVPV